MNKKLTVFAIILIVVGIVGTISSGIASIPYFVNTASKIEKELNKETIIFNNTLKVNKLNINTQDGNVTIKKHDKEEIIITKKGNEKNTIYDIKNNENELLIKQSSNTNDYKEIKDFNDVINFMIKQIYSYNTNAITVYVPNDVDLNIVTGMGSLIVGEDVLLNELKFKTLSGNISLPNQVKELNILEIISKNYIQLSMTELLGIKDIKINCDSVNIYSNGDDIFIDNIEKYIPNNLDIIQSNNDYANIDIVVDIPVAKNLNIVAHKSNTQIDMPIEKYKFIFDLKSLEDIDLEDLTNHNIINEQQINQYQGVRELKGSLNKSLDNLEEGYNVNIKSNYIYLK